MATRTRRRYNRRPMKKQTTKAIARKEAVKVLNKNIELKKAYVPNFASNTVDYTGESHPLYPTLQGDSDQEYIGQKILIKSIHVRGMLECADAWNSLRVVIVQWKGAAPNTTVAGGNASEVLYIPSANFTSYLQDYDDQRRQRFRVLFDKTYTVVLNQSNIIKNFEIKLKPKLRPTHYYDSGGIVQDGAVRMYLISDSSNITAPIVNMQGVVYYQDA